MKRRNFIQVSSAFTMGAILSPVQACSSLTQKEIGLQLYTIRDMMAKTPEKTLEQVASLGYSYVEGAGYNDGLFYGFKPAKFAEILKGLGLSFPSTHTVTELTSSSGKENMSKDFQKVADDAAASGASYLVYAYLKEHERRNIEDYKQHAETFNLYGEICKKSGIQFAYHNHDFEFIQMGGQKPYDLLLKECDENLVKMELDLYWITKGGYSPLEYFKSNPGRFPLWHVKDMEDTPEQFFTEVGNGTIDFKAIFDKEKLSGMQYFFVEQDTCKQAPIKSVEVSINNLKEEIL